MNVVLLEGHIASLCRKSRIACLYNGGHVNDSWGSPYVRQIAIAPVVGEVSYAVALHELGHVLGRYQKSWVILTRERYAWHWARDHAIAWTPVMQRRAALCLSQYELRPEARGLVGMEMSRKGGRWTYI
jgi:hypothetical protein